VITKLDWRSLEHLIDLSEPLDVRGVDLVVLDRHVDRRGPTVLSDSAVG